MKMKTMCLVASLLMAAALVLASSQAAVGAGGPQYGGELRLVETSEPISFDPADRASWVAHHMIWPVTNKLVEWDWFKGPAGTNEWPFNGQFVVYLDPGLMSKGVCESWEMHDPQHVTLHLRKGVMWQDKPGIMKARELNADDIVWWMNYMMASDISNWATMKERPEKITKIDNYTVHVKLRVPAFRFLTEKLLIEYAIIPPEVAEKKGDMSDWKDVTGTGAFKLTKYVEGSSLTYKRNDKYWDKDPKGNRLPYVDTLKYLIIKDRSTQIAALRAGKVDVLHGVQKEDAESLEKTNPELERGEILRNYIMKILPDMKKPPFGPTMDANALKVRRAAALAIDQPGIAKKFYGGRAIMHPSAVVGPGLPVDRLRVKNMPPERKELYEYHPEKAKKLLAEAGYPNGFNINIHLNPTGTYPDVAALLKAYWDAVGIKTTLKVHEPAAFSALQHAFSMDGMMLAGYGFGSAMTGPYTTEGEGKPNYANWNSLMDPQFDVWADKLAGMSDMEARIDLLQTIVLRVIDNAFELTVPTPYLYSYWQPWIGGYHGEVESGFDLWEKLGLYIWVDKSKKK